jgi:hypothetical protein
LGAVVCRAEWAKRCLQNDTGRTFGPRGQKSRPIDPDEWAAIRADPSSILIEAWEWDSLVGTTDELRDLLVSAATRAGYQEALDLMDSAKLFAEWAARTILGLEVAGNNYLGMWLLVDEGINRYSGVHGANYNWYIAYTTGYAPQQNVEPSGGTGFGTGPVGQGGGTGEEPSASPSASGGEGSNADTSGGYETPFKGGTTYTGGVGTGFGHTVTPGELTDGEEDDEEDEEDGGGSIVDWTDYWYMFGGIRFNAPGEAISVGFVSTMFRFWQYV